MLRKEPLILPIRIFNIETPELTAELATGLIQAVTKSQSVKKGMVMKPLRCALTGDVHGPELIPSFLLLHQRGLAVERLQGAIAVA